MNNTEIINELEKILLPKDCFFSKEQKDVIFSEGNANIIAGPGSGKTTVLIAKIAFLIKKDNLTDGICIITHTNVAVDEIKTKLAKVGINSFGYPNFIGTIHEFFNHFFSYKAYQELFPGKAPTILEEEEEYELIFKTQFEEYRTERYTYPPPTSKMKSNFLKFNQDGTYDLKFYCSDSYKDIVLNSLISIIKNGELRHNDTLSLTEWYIEKYNHLIKEAFNLRFSWLLLDEAQDTSSFQFDLLNKIVDLNKINFQRYGDPYQSLYNMYDGNSIEAWVPLDEETVFTPLELSNSSRFGDSIAKVLKTTCIERYSTFSGNPEMTSFKPHLIVYRDKKQVVDAYLKIIEDFNEYDNEFKESTKKIAIVGSEHNHLKDYKSTYEKPKNVKVKTESILKLLYNLILKVLYNYIKIQGIKKANFSYFDLINMANERLEFRSELSEVLKAVINNSGVFDELSKVKLRISLETLLEINQEIDNGINKIVDYIIKETSIIYQTFNSNETTQSESVIRDEIFFGTVHAVKGETHKATLLIDSTITEFKYKPNMTTYNLVELIIEYLTGDFVDYMSTDCNIGVQNATKKALKIAYVALSRPTHLACVAVSSDALGDNLDYVINKSKNFGWEVIVLKS